MSEPSEESLRLYRAAMRVTQELREANDLLRPIHERVMRLQDKSREAYERMNLSFAQDGLNPSEAYRACERKDNP